MNHQDYYRYTDRTLDRLRNVVSRLMQSPIAGGVLLLICALISLLWANSGFSNSYAALQTTQLTIGIGDNIMSQSILFWINDGLMVIFFFVVGLEIKSEVLHGELSSWKKAALPGVAAIGGMVVPALIFAVFNYGTPYMNGWGIPMATDIAFAIGILALLGKRVPSALRIFLLALAIVDDLGAIIVIAIFYTTHFSLASLLLGLLGVGFLYVLNRLGARNLGLYTVLGIPVWIAFLNSGVHPTIAGVLVALTVPSTAPISLNRFFRDTNVLLNNSNALNPEVQLSVHRKYMTFDSIGRGMRLAESPMRRAEKGLYIWVNFLIMPLFALFNAGVVLSGMSLTQSLTTPIALGIVLGLFLGKQLGIFLFSWIATKLKIASLPESLTWRQFYGMAILGGIGFTMSLFIAGLAYTDSQAYLNEAKLGIIIGSLLSAIVGLLFLRNSLHPASLAGISSTDSVLPESEAATFPDTMPDTEENTDERQ